MAPPLTGWRCWRYDGGRLVPPFPTSLPVDWHDGVNVATCNRCASAPDPVHAYGIYVVPDLDRLLRYLRARHFGSPWVVGQVRCSGRILPSWVSGDPPGTVRVEQAERVGELFQFTKTSPGQV